MTSSSERFAGRSVGFLQISCTNWNDQNSLLSGVISVVYIIAKLNKK